MKVWIGLDIGSTNVKAIALTTANELVAEASMPCTTYRPKPQQTEQDPDEIYYLCVHTLRQLTDQLHDKNAHVEAVSLCSAMHSVIALDAQNRRLTRAMLWSDNRSEAQANGLKNNPLSARLYKQTGIPPHPYAPSTKVRWLAEKQPNVFKKTARFASQKEYVWFKWFGKWQADYSLASGTALFDNKKLAWSHLALDYAGIKPSQLSDAVTTTHIEYLTDAFNAQVLGLPVGTPFVIGAGDACLANLGSGALEKGVTTLTIGTSGAVRQTTPKPVSDPRQRLFTYVLDETHFVAGGPTNNGGNVLEWLSQHLLKRDPAELLDMAQNAPVGAEGLVFVPYLSGERAPVWNANARGSYQNVAWQHTQAHFARATFEGIVMNLNQIRSILDRQISPTQVLHANGGFTRSAFWVQLIADVFGVPVRINETSESGCVGAILLAMKALGNITTLEEGVKKHIHFGLTYEPNPNHRAFYKKHNQRFAALIP
jgi:gluconokinase